jgi:hypothetical protein
MDHENFNTDEEGEDDEDDFTAILSEFELKKTTKRMMNLMITERFADPLTTAEL